MAKKNLTIKTVEALKGDGLTTWDAKLPGFGVRVFKSGAKTFILKYKINGRQRVMTLGRLGDDLTVDQARNQAEVARGKVRSGTDPQDAKDATRNHQTLANVWKAYGDHRSKFPFRKRKPWRDGLRKKYDGSFDNYVAKLLGHRPLNSITRTDIEDLREAITSEKFTLPVKRDQTIHNKGREATANRVLAYLGGCFTWAIHQGHYNGVNPTSAVDKFEEKARDRVLTDDELNRYLAAVEAFEGNVYVKAALKLYVYTACRREEVLELRWANVRLDEARVLLRDAKGGDESIPLSAEAVEVLRCLPRIVGNPYVICGEKEGAHLVNISKPFANILEAAKITGATIHDLRRTYGSQCLLAGVDIYALSKLLRHKSVTTTERAYAWMPKAVLHAAAARAAERISEVAAGGHNKVVSIRRTA